MPRTDIRKLEAAIYYICDKAKELGVELDPIKLNKVLWYSDSAAFLKSGQSITGSVYIRKPFGPVARYNQIAVENLEKAGLIKRGRISGDNHRWETCFDVLDDLDDDSEESRFVGDEMTLMDDMIQYIKTIASEKVSEDTHGDVWELAKQNEEIPLYAAFAENLGTITPDLMQAAREAA